MGKTRIFKEGSDLLQTGEHMLQLKGAVPALIRRSVTKGQCGPRIACTQLCSQRPETHNSLVNNAVFLHCL